MEALKMYELVDIFENQPQNAVRFKSIEPYKKQLYTYFKRQYNCEPILLVTTVTNTSTYCRIVSEENFISAVLDYMGESSIDLDDDESEVFAEYETLCFNSRLLKELL